jgi:hypothetical protein
MRRLAAVLLILSACGSPSSSPAPEISDDAPPFVRATPVTDLEFNDQLLQGIAMNLIREARARGIEEISGRNRVERLLLLEASLGDSHLALDRVNELVRHLTAHDVSEWAKLRQRAELEFGPRDDVLARRVNDLLERWRHEKSESAFRYLSSNYKTFMSSMEWERRFHDFVAARPVDAATWGWLLLRANERATIQQYGRADAETAYRYYLELTGLGDGREAKTIFSVPGIEIAEER